METKKVKPVKKDISETFAKGKASSNLLVRVATTTAEFLWRTPTIYGNAVMDIEVPKKRGCR